MAQTVEPIDALFREHHDEILRLAIRMVGGRDQGEDVVMSVWLRLLGRDPAISLPQKPRSYLFRAVRNMALDHLERRHREADLIDPQELVEIRDPAALDGPDRLILMERIACLVQALNALGANCRRAFILCRLDGLSYAEIARLMGISVSMVEKHMIHALKQCRAALRAIEAA